MKTATALEPWLCAGTLKDGQRKGSACRRTLLDAEFIGTGAAILRRVCDRCGTVNVLRLEQRAITNRDSVLD